MVPNDAVDLVSTLPLIATQLWVNLSQPEALARALTMPVDGIGLLRSEFMLLEVLERQHPLVWLQQGRREELIERMADCLTQFVSAFQPRPVWYRSLDFRAHELQSLVGAPTAIGHPMLGMRGTFSYQQDVSWFDLELAAVQRVCQAGYQNLHLLLPFVRTVEEFIFCRQRLEQIGLTQQRSLQLWIMAEVPSVLFLLPEYVRAGVQGIAIGTNDLIQLLLGVDRDHPQLAAAFNERHPVVMQAIAHLIQQAQQLGIPCSICGHAPAQSPELIDALIAGGITAISVDVNAVASTYRAIARAEQRLLLRASQDQLSKSLLSRL